MIERSYTSNVGFLPKKTYNLEGGDVKNIDNPVGPGDHTSLFDNSHSKDSQIKKAIVRAINAYAVDGFIRNCVDRHAELFKDFVLQGEQEPTAYVQKRLTLMSLRTGEHWKTTISRYIHEYFKHGNPFLLKIRSGDVEPAARPLFKARPYSLAAFFVVSPEKLEIHYKNKKFIGWMVKGKENTGVTLFTGSQSTNKDKALITTRLPQDTKGVLFPGMDVIHTAYKKPSDSHYGIGLVFASMEDIGLLRNMEQTVSVMVKKNSIPILWHRVTRPVNPAGGIQTDINNAVRMHQSSAPDGVIVTPGTHELKMLGSESHAMRNEGYLKYFAYRSFAGMGMSPFLMGFEAASMGAVDAAIEILMQRIRFCQEELSRDLEMFLINEILWEGGFDPFTNEAHQVKLLVKDIDEARLIKLRTHFADLYTKNVITFDEFRNTTGFYGKVDDNNLYLNRVTIPLEKEKAKLAPNPNGTPNAVPKKAKPSKENLRPLLPVHEVEVVDFIEVLFKEFNLDLTPHYLELKSLLHDEEALIEYVLMKNQEETDGINSTESLL